MQSKRVMIAVFAASALAVSSLVVAANKGQVNPPSAPMMGMERKDMDHDKMMGGGMMGMMSGCNRMMDSGMMDSGMMPHLPPGNEKLQLQMQAEMLQKMGEILNKYAEQINVERGGPR